MFFGRQNELKRLNALFDSGKFEFVVVHGRRRVGKTALIREFIKDKNSVYFAARETSGSENLFGFFNAVWSLNDAAFGEPPPFGNCREVFEALFELAHANQIVVVLDNYPALAASYRDFADELAAAIDARLMYSRLMIIICGAAPHMDNEALGYDSPFYGRRTAQIKLEPFTFFETRRFFGGFSLFDTAVVYGATGGVPRYLTLMDTAMPIEDNIRRCFFEPDAVLLEEPDILLRHEVREPAFYNAVLKTIADGAVKNSEIAAAVGLETSACSAYLKNLAARGIIAKITPITEKSGKKTFYEISDHLFRFWYTFIPDNISYIMSGTADRVWRGVARRIPDYMSTVFEEICRAWLIQQSNMERLPIKLTDIGRWWGTVPGRSREVIRLPILAYSDDDNALLAECVWSDERADAEALHALIRKSELIACRRKFLYLFSRSGFTEACAAEAVRSGANLVMFE